MVQIPYLEPQAGHQFISVQNLYELEKSEKIFLDLHFQSLERWSCLLYTSPSPRDRTRSRMPSSA